MPTVRLNTLIVEFYSLFKRKFSTFLLIKVCAKQSKNYLPLEKHVPNLVESILHTQKL